jgi:hypothetical protein
MSDVLKILAEAMKDRLSRLNFWQVLLLVVAVIFSVAAAHHYFR